LLAGAFENPFEAVPAHQDVVGLVVSIRVNSYFGQAACTQHGLRAWACQPAHTFFKEEDCEFCWAMLWSDEAGKLKAISSAAIWDQTLGRHKSSPLFSGGVTKAVTHPRGLQQWAT